MNTFKTLIVLICMAILTGCMSTGKMTGRNDINKPRSVFIEPFNGYQEYPELYEYAGIALGRRGYDATNEPGASYRLKSSLTWSSFNIFLSVRLVDAQSGHVVYFGECRNPGFGTLRTGKAMNQCFNDALDALE